MKHSIEWQINAFVVVMLFLCTCNDTTPSNSFTSNTSATDTTDDQRTSDNKDDKPDGNESTIEDEDAPPRAESDSDSDSDIDIDSHADAHSDADSDSDSDTDVESHSNTDSDSDSDSDKDMDSDEPPSERPEATDSDLSTDTEQDTVPDISSDSQVTATSTAALESDTALDNTTTANSDTEESSDTPSSDSDESDGPINETDRPTGPVYVMPMGDSITATGCWRARLWDRLMETGYDTIDFVGTQLDTNGGCESPDYDRDHEGYSGARVSDVTLDQMAEWFAEYTPDIVLLHFGTNDVWGGRTTQQIIDGHSRVIEGLRAANPHVILLIAKIIPVAPSNCDDCPENTVILNDAVAAWAEDHTTNDSPIIVVDQWTGFDPSADTTDGVHPYEESGAQKIADKWYEALISAL